MQILITAGGTEEPIDGVRTISNFSTGRTGAVIADSFTRAGYDVTLVTSLRGASPTEDMEVIRYQSFNDLNTEIKKLLSRNNFSGMIHLAAVSDYSVQSIISGDKIMSPDKDIKLDSSKPLTIKMKPNFKIIEKIKEYSNHPLTLVGFKLTKNADEETIKRKVNKLLSTGKVDYVVHNDLTSIDKNSHISTIYREDQIIGDFKNKEEMASGLIKIFKEN